MNLLFGTAFCLFFVTAGLHVWRKGMVNFIAGYEEGSIRDEKGLARRIGIVIMAFGAECFILLCLNLYLHPLEAYYIGILAIVNVSIVLLLFIQAKS